MFVVSRVAGVWARRRLAAMRRMATSPEAAQGALLKRFVRAGARTEFGTLHGFRRIRSAADFRRHVPLSDYARMARWWDRERRGETDLTWPGRTRTFGLSSGTTSGEKYLPLTAATLRTNRKGALDALVPHLADGGTDIFDGKLLFLGGATALREEGGVQIGDHTGILSQRMPRFVRRLHTPSAEVAAIPSWDAKLPRAAAEALDADVRLLGGIPSWLLLFADQVLAQAKAAGRPHETLVDLWPNLSVVVHGGTSFTPYAERMRQVLGVRTDGRPIRLIETYSATEGGMLGIEDVPGAMLPVLDRSAYLELVPTGDVADATPRRVGLEDAEPGVDYALALTTNAGQWAYLVGDIVRFEPGLPRRLVFAGRLAQMMNGFGEHVSVGEIDRAVHRAATELELRTHEHAVGALYPREGDAHGRHVWYVEIEGPVPPDLERMATVVDRSVAGGNEDYSAHRAGGQGLGLPEIVPLPPGTFFEWMREEGRLGGQNKVPRVLAPTRHEAFRAWLAARHLHEPATRVAARSLHA